MLKELDQYENLGTPKFFSELFNQLNGAEQRWTRDHVRGYFYNRIIENNTVFDGCLPLAEAVGAVKITDNETITLNPSLVTPLINEKYLNNKLLEMILVKAKEDDIFHEIFCSKNISYDIIYRLIQIDVSAFRFRHANFRRLLIDFNFLYSHPDENIKKYIINSKYKKLFDREIMPEIKRRKLGIEELEQLLERKQIYGDEAEIFVLDFERKRLLSHHQSQNIERISLYDVAAGYDIVSYDDLQSAELDRFIEVKSFSGVPSFFWSRNEIDVARVKKDKYFLYLIDRDRMSFPQYVPIMVQNPYKEIINNDIVWAKRVESYFVKKNE